MPSRALPEGWRTCAFEELGHVVTGKTPPTKHTDYYGGTIPFITPTDMDGRKVIDSTERYLTPKGVEVVRSSLIPRGEVFVSCIGSDMGKVGMTATTSVTNQQINSIIVESPNDAEYVFYSLSRRKDEFQRLATSGSAQPILNKGHFSKLEIILPPPDEQHAIAHILGTLDDKIELNRQMNQTMEAMAQALFKNWFVDFEPFRDKGMEDSPLGEIPVGWHCATVAEAIEVNPPRRLNRETNAIYVDMSALPTAAARVLNTIRRPYSGSGSRFTNGDVLVARITPCLENGKTALVDFMQDGEIGWGSTEFIVLVPKPPIGTSFVYCLARHPDFRTNAIQAMTGTSGRQRVDVSCFSHYWLAVPDAVIAQRFEQQVKSWFQKMKANDDESQTLAAIRDALLPRLLSGEIRVKDAEKFVGEAV